MGLAFQSLRIDRMIDGGLKKLLYFVGLSLS